MNEKRVKNVDYRYGGSEMNKKDVLKAFLTGVFSITPFFGISNNFRSVDVDEKVIDSGKSSVKPVKVRLRPLIEDIGECFDDVGSKLRSSMNELKNE